MIDPAPLFAVQTSFEVLLLECEVPVASSVRVPWSEAGLEARVVRGQKMRTKDRLFDEVAAALQFPSYFGENWDALDECLADLEWLPTAFGYVLVVTDAVEVLADAPALLSTFVSCLGYASREWTCTSEMGVGADRPPTPFHVVLQATPRDAAAVAERWAAAGAAVVPFPS